MGIIPDQYALNGTDCFLLTLDKLMLRSSGWNNVCRFVVELDADISVDELNALLRENEAYRKITSLRLKTGCWFSLPRWAADARAGLPAVHEFEAADRSAVQDVCFEKVVSPDKGSPFRVNIIRYANGTSALLFTWHHALMDAHGAEMFINHLGGGVPFDPDLTIEPVKPDWQKILKFKQFLYDVSQQPLESLFRKKVRRPVSRNRILSFTAEESKIIEKKAGLAGAVFNRSLFYLAATARAMRAMNEKRGLKNEDYFIPVPQDRRKRGANGPMLRNQVTFLFYRIKNDALGEIDTAVKDLTDQMMQMMRMDAPTSYRVMMEYSRRLPGFIYQRMLQNPTKGLMASFFFSDTGNSLKDFTHFAGRNVNDAVHFPPNLYPPGVTLIYSSFNGRINLTVGYMEDTMTPEELDEFIGHLRRDLVEM